jgi:hypothetical protein
MADRDARRGGVDCGFRGGLGETLRLRQRLQLFGQPEGAGRRPVLADRPRACKFADKNKKYPGPAIVAVARFPCKDGNFVNQFAVAK